MTAILRYRAHSGPVLLSAGCRPFFLGASIWAALGVPLWLGAYAEGLVLPAQPPPFVWHAHEMIYGVLCGGDCARAERRCLGATIWTATRAYAAIDFDSSGARGYRGREHYGPGRSWWSSLEA